MTYKYIYELLAAWQFMQQKKAGVVFNLVLLIPFIVSAREFCTFWCCLHLRILFGVMPSLRRLAFFVAVGVLAAAVAMGFETVGVGSRDLCGGKLLFVSVF